MIPLIGYGHRLSVRPGETIEFKISSQGPEPFEASLVRVISADPNPAGPGMLEEPVDAAFAGSYPSRVQPVHRGSHGRIDGSGPLGGLDSLTFTATIWPTSPEKANRVSCPGSTRRRARDSPLPSAAMVVLRSSWAAARALRSG